MNKKKKEKKGRFCKNKEKRKERKKISKIFKN